MDQSFELFDIELEVIEINGKCTCDMEVSDKITFSGGKLFLPRNDSFCFYALQSALPLIPVKQRKNHQNDWIETDSKVTCPDPACGLIMEIRRLQQKTFNHNDVSANKM